VNDFAYWGLRSYDGELHITFEYFGMENPGDIPKEVQLGKKYGVFVTHSGVYMKDGKIMNTGIRVELPEELLPFYKNPAVPHITLECHPDSVPKNTALCSWKELDSLHRGSIQMEVFGFSISAFKMICDKLISLLKSSEVKPEPDEIQDWIDYICEKSTEVSKLKTEFPVEFQSRHLAERLLCELN
jgi:hypothetical protein